MNGDALKKVRPGDPLHIPAEAYNRFIDAARAVRGPGIRPGASSPGPPSGVALACNASGINAPMGAAVELAPRSETQAQIEFVRPGQDGGAGVYGIACEPIPAGRIGRIAVSGGPYKLRCHSDSISTGSPLGAQEGEWYASEVEGPKTWVALSDQDENGYARVVFSGDVGGLVFCLNRSDWWNDATTDNLEIPVGEVIIRLTYLGRDFDGNLIIGVNTGCLMVNP